jgi:gamma-glutamyltranspeptidase/glutathione hydrolase
MGLGGVSRLGVTIAAALTIALTVGGPAALAADGGGRPAPEVQRVAVGAGGAVATTHPAATRAGIEILRSGGNAVDAAVAAAAVSGLTNPGNNGPGGLSYMTIYLSQQQRAVVIGDRAPAPAAFGRRTGKGS